MMRLEDGKWLAALKWSGRKAGEGFGAFSCSGSQLGAVICYIENQQNHHAKKSFR